MKILTGILIAIGFVAGLAPLNSSYSDGRTKKEHTICLIILIRAAKTADIHRFLDHPESFLEPKNPVSTEAKAPDRFPSPIFTGRVGNTRLFR